MYRITSPEQLREILPLVKNARAARSTANLATVWAVATRQNKPNAFAVYIKLGRNASLCRDYCGAEIVLGELKLKETRELVRDLHECEEGEKRENH